jgi:hypothetical protein
MLGGPAIHIVGFVAPAAHPRNLARATLAGFVAAVAMLSAFGLAYGAAGLLAEAAVLNALGLQVVREWLQALTNNQVIDLARPNLYAALGLHLAAGVLWALVYAGALEPRLSDPDWQRGVVFALIPAIFSLVVFLPTVGGGFFGVAIGAGPLPVIGNLALHAVYGVALGDLYGLLGSVIDAEDPVARAADGLALAHAEVNAVRGLIVGLAVGLAVSGLGMLVAQLAGDMGWTLSASLPQLRAIGDRVAQLPAEPLRRSAAHRGAGGSTCHRAGATSSAPAIGDLRVIVSPVTVT